jgi:hypothetical protein
MAAIAEPEAEAVVGSPASQPIAQAAAMPTPSQPFVVEAVSSVDTGARPTPSQPFTVEAVADVTAGSRPTPSQPFTVEAVPKVVEQVRAERVLTPQDLLAPPLFEKTPRGIGAVTLASAVSSPSRPSSPVALESTAFSVAPIVPIAAALPVQSEETKSPRLPTPTKNQDDPGGSSSQSKLERAPSSESGLSGAFFAAHDVTVPPAELRQSQDSDDFIDERQRRSISPEVVARRTRYRAVVVRVIVVFVVLLAAAIALKLVHKR